ncbi:MAG: UpxY family transcription antiterminator [Chlamydiota bacterium]
MRPEKRWGGAASAIEPDATLAGIEIAAVDPPPPHWYAAYTCVNRERRVAEMLQARAVTCFLPLYEEVHQWKTGPARLQVPLFPGYVFVRVFLEERMRVLTVPGVVRLVGTNGRAEALPDPEIEGIRAALMGPVRVHPYPYLTVGQQVTVVNGPLRGLTGFLLRKRNSCRVVISLDLIMRSMIVEVDAADCVPVRAPALSAVRRRNTSLAA